MLAVRALDRLLGAVDDQGFRLFAADLDPARDPENLDRQSLNPPQGSADRRLIRLVQTGQKILRDVASVKDQKHQQMLFQPADAQGRPARFLGLTIRSRQ